MLRVLVHDQTLQYLVGVAATVRVDDEKTAAVAAS